MSCYNRNRVINNAMLRPAATSMLLGDFLYLVQHQTENTTEEVYYIEYLALHQYLGQVSDCLYQHLSCYPDADVIPQMY